jgi:nucleoid DNA-binding protein
MNKQQPIGVITGTSSKGEGVQIKDFGSFVVRRRAACTGRNLTSNEMKWDSESSILIWHLKLFE